MEEPTETVDAAKRRLMMAAHDLEAAGALLNKASVSARSHEDRRQRQLAADYARLAQDVGREVRELSGLARRIDQLE